LGSKRHLPDRWFVRDHRSLARYGYTCGLAGLVLLVTPARLPARFSEVNWAKNWILLAGFHSARRVRPTFAADLLRVLPGRRNYTLNRSHGDRP